MKKGLIGLIVILACLSLVSLEVYAIATAF